MRMMDKLSVSWFQQEMVYVSLVSTNIILKQEYIGKATKRDQCVFSAYINYVSDFTDRQISATT